MIKKLRQNLFQNPGKQKVKRAQKSSHSQTDTYHKDSVFLRLLFGGPGNFFHFLDRPSNVVSKPVRDIGHNFILKIKK
jgi:hypothetical protein